MNVKHSLIYPQSDEDSVMASPDSYPTVRTRAEAKCPGRASNIITLVTGEDALFGIKRPKNIGSCSLFIGCFDRSGTRLDSIEIKPGEELAWYRIPSNAYAIKFGCHTECNGTAILEYDTPFIA